MKDRITKRITRFKGKAFDVENVELNLPDGRTAKYDLVDHIGSVTIVPIDEQGNVYLVRQYRIGAERELLELPAGTLSPKENPRHCALREVREEVGMKAGKLTEIGDFFLAPGYSTERMHIFLATDLTPDPLPRDADEFLAIEVMPIRDAHEMVRRNRIKDCKTIAALMLALPYCELKPSFK